MHLQCSHCSRRTLQIHDDDNDDFDNEQVKVRQLRVCKFSRIKRSLFDIINQLLHTVYCVSLLYLIVDC